MHQTESKKYIKSKKTIMVVSFRDSIDDGISTDCFKYYETTSPGTIQFGYQKKFVFYVPSTLAANNGFDFGFALHKIRASNIL